MEFNGIIVIQLSSKFKIWCSVWFTNGDIFWYKTYLDS